MLDPPIDKTDLSTSPPSASSAEESLGPFVESLFDQRDTGLRPARIGRYTVLRKLGEGGMGVVHACYDEELERRVAVKLLRSQSTSMSARRRMMREAQGLARLTHPNVVRIYEVGRHKGELFLAMEYVEGRTLDGWTRPDWRGTCALLLQAGRGLEAAHAAGLIHRDFKPANVMIGSDGLVRVLDFGLVRARDGSDEEELAATDDDEPALRSAASSSLAHTLTREGTIMGTPAYMAPEQLAGGPVTTRADQFSFCVVAFELLFEYRPYDTRALAPTEAPTLAALPERSDVPKPLRQAIVRGLALDPDQRWPNMGELLAVFEAALGRDSRSWRRAIVGGGLILATSFGVGMALTSSPEPPCQLDASALAGVWDDARAAELRTAFEATGLPFASTSANRAIARIDAWSSEWLDSQRQACEATRVAGTQSEAMLDKRSACLERGRRALKASVATLVDADTELVGRSAVLLDHLPSPSACSQPELVEVRYPPPSDHEARRALMAGFEQVSQIRALIDAGRFDQAMARASALRPEIVALDYVPLTLGADALPAQLSLGRREVASAVPRQLEVIRAAEAALLDELVADLRVELANHAAAEWGDPRGEQWLLADAQAALARVEHEGDPRRHSLMTGAAALDDQSGDHQAALAGFIAARDYAREIGRTWLAERDRRNIAQQLANLGRFDEARAELDAALEAALREEGPGGPLVADIEHDLGLLATSVGRFEDAAPHLERSRRMYSAIYGPASPQVSQVDYAAAHLALVTGDLERAGELFDATLAAWRDDETVEPDWLAHAHEGRGAVAFYTGDLDAALVDYREALAIRERLLGPEHHAVATSHANIGEALAARGEHRAALDELDEALRILELRLPADHLELAFPLQVRGQARLALGLVDAAIEDLERAVALHEANPAEPLARAEAEAALARARAAMPSP